MAKQHTRQAHRGLPAYALTDDQLMEAYAGSVNRLLDGKTIEVQHEAIGALREFLTRDLAGHFRYEEKVIFPVLKVAHKESVDRLLADHEMILQQARDLDAMLAQHGATTEVGIPMRRSFQMLANELKKHSAAENKMFPSLL